MISRRAFLGSALMALPALHSVAGIRLKKIKTAPLDLGPGAPGFACI